MNRFMAKLLKGECFDRFLLKEGFLRTGIEYRFQGHIFKEYYELSEQELLTEEYAAWSEVKTVVFDLIKGKKTPLAFSFTLQLARRELPEFLEQQNVSVGEDTPSLFLQVRFDHGTGHIVTGTARNVFTLDKTLEEAWDAYVKQYLKQEEIPVEEE